jgi:hypothetical protein
LFPSYKFLNFFDSKKRIQIDRTNLGSTGWIIGMLVVLTLTGLYFQKRLEAAAYSV